MYRANQSSIGLRAALELEVPVPSGRRAFDPLQLLFGHGNVVVHRLDVAWIGEDVAANLVQEGRPAAAANALQSLTLVSPGGAESPCGESFGGPDRLRI